MINTNFTILEEISITDEIKICKVTDKKEFFILKTINSDTNLNKSIAHLENDFELTKTLNDKSVSLVPISFTRNDLTCFSLFEYVDYIPLSEFIKEKQNKTKLFEIIKNIIKKLEIIHSKKIIFLNISLDSIFISKETFDIKFIDFSISTKKTKQESQWKNFKEADDNTFLNVKNDYWNEIKNSTKDTLNGSPFFISPESTGRNNRDIDYRSDFYSLGILMYYLFTNSFPFKNKDLLSVIHFHLAGEIQESILEDKLLFVIKKLLNKNAEKRYQSEKKLYFDLEALEKNEDLSTFPDISSTFIFQQKLYGREKESEALLNSFNCFMSDSISRSVFVSGCSGIGKTLLVKEIGKKINEKKVYFLKSKYDVLQRIIPLSPIIEIFRSLIKSILAESDEIIQEYEKDLLRALGKNAKIITDIIPELEFIIGGPQPELPNLSPSETSYRFYTTFINFIKVFSSKEIPLIIFLDDMQWVDSVSLALLNNLIIENEISNIFFIFAYRDNEALPGSAFKVFISKITSDKKKEINLQPLREDDIGNILSDSLFIEKEKLQDLSLTIFLNTKGNPFFIMRFIKKLVDDGLIYFDNFWQFNIIKIKSIRIDGDIIGLLIDKFNNLNVETIEILKIASTIGNKFTLSRLSSLTNQDQKQIQKILNQVIEEELINFNNIKKEIVYSFKHDKIQEAFYKILDNNKKIEIALDIARNSKSDEELFDKVNNYNIAMPLLTDVEEICIVVQLNLEAGKKAKEATAYQTSSNYFQNAYQLLFKFFNIKHPLFFEILKESSEAFYLCGKLEDAEKIILDNLQYIDNILEQSELYNLLMIQYSATGEFKLATDTIKKALLNLDTVLPERDFQETFKNDMNKIHSYLKDKNISDLINLPLMTDPIQIIKVKLLMNTYVTAYNTVPELASIISLKLILLYLQYGNLTESWGYSSFTIHLITVLNKYQEAYDFAKLSMEVSKKYNDLIGITKAANILANYGNPWVKPIRDSDEINLLGIQSAIESGEFLHGSYSALHYVVNSFYQGKLLKHIVNEHKTYLDFSIRAKNSMAIDTITGMMIGIHSLITENKDLLFAYEEDSEESYLRYCEEHQSPYPVGIYKTLKIGILYLHEKYTEAYQLILDSKALLPFFAGINSVSEFNFYESLTICALIRNKELSIDKLSVVLQNQEQMKKWMESCSENFTGKYLLIEAQMLELNNKLWEAQLLYDEAIDDFDKNDFIQNEAIALKLVGEFHYIQNNHKKAQRYLFSAYGKFKKWGAVNALNLLKEKYSNFVLFKDKKTNEESIDLTALSKSSTLFFNEIKLSSLTQKIMEVIIQNTGAQKGALFIEKNNKLELYCSTDNQNIPLSVINYVERTFEFLVLDNAYDDLRFNKDRIIKDKEIKSILCMPILKANELIGVLYLENNLGKGFFTDDRFQFIKIISSQIGASIENAILYSNLEEKVQERTMELAQKNKTIIDSIDYAKRIQYATLPSKDLISNRLKNFSVMFKPKDIVSGDFYWYAETSESTFIAVVDCTGHGVPGAFLSMIGTMLLNQIVKENKIIDPISIIETLNIQIKTLLKNNENGVNDSMEICLCRIDKDKIIYCGSRPFYYTKNGKINVIKNKNSNSRIEIKDKNKYTFYLSSDGIQDQHNNERMKFTSKKLLELIEKYSSFSAEEQIKKIESEITVFQKEEKQRDDITLICFVIEKY